MTNVYDQFLRRTNLTLNSQPSTLNHRYTYGQASRLDTVSDGTDSVTYSYVENSPLVDNIVFQHSGTTRMTTTKRYDALNRLTSITNGPSGAGAIGSRYVYNTANQRTSVTNADTSRWVYSYDKLGQVISGKKYWSDNTPVAGQQFEYAFDDIGNRRTNGFGGNEVGLSLRESRYAVNDLNQYTSRTVPGYVNVLGDATNTASVSVNTNLAYRKDRYFRVELGVNNSSSPVWLGITNVAVMPVGSGNYVVSNATGHAFVPKTPESFGYDADGNLTNDGRWALTWDGENRLIRMESKSDAPTGSKLKLVFDYDWQGRRISKTVSNWVSGNWQSQSTNRFVYDGWNLIATLNSQLSPINSFMWGLDLSGTMQGAGGVGGLLVVYDSSTINSQPSTHFACYDGNGNVTALVKATDGTASANYEYGPFGELLRATGPLAKANPFRFSTKYQDDESDLLYYGYRSYNPTLGRWLSRDPIEEEGGLNLYAFVDNNGVNWSDDLGKQPINKPPQTPQTPKQVYCDAAKKHPDNKWLACACNVSAEINALISALYVTGPFVDNPKKNGEIIRWFDCTRSCIFKKFNEFYKVYDGGAAMGDVNLTPHWEAACNKCIGKPGAVSAKDCCSAMVTAEQSAVEDCKGKCGEFPGNSTKLPIPGFDGDFSKLDDRIKYGLKRCCEDSKGQGKNPSSK